MFLRFLHFWPYFGQFLADRQQKHNSDEGPSKEGSYQVWLKSAENCRRSRLLKKSLTDTRTHGRTDRRRTQSDVKNPS